MRAPAITTERLILRSFEPNDVSALADVLSDKDAMSDLYAMGDVPQEPVGFAAWLIDDALSSWKKSGFGNWAMCTSSPEPGPDQKVIGFAGFLSEDLLLESPEEALEAGWGIHPDFAGRGLATEACIAAFDHAFEMMKAGRILAITSEENAPSRRLMERLGMKQSEDASPYGLDGCVLYSVTNEHWRGRASAIRA